MELPPEEEEALEPEGELHTVEQMLAGRAPYDEVVSALDALAARAPADDAHARASIAHIRLSAASMYHRSDPEIAQAIEQYLDAETVPWRRLSAVLAACMDSPDLFRQYVNLLIADAAAADADADAAAAADADAAAADADAADADALAQVLATALLARKRVLGQ